MSFNNRGYMNDYRQQSSSQGYNNYYDYSKQQQGWFGDQNYQEQYYSTNNGYTQPEYTSRNQQTYTHNRQNNINFQQYSKKIQNQTIPQQQQQYSNFRQNWTNRNKRSHEYIEPTSTFSATNSPEPKRQVQRQNSFQNPKKSSIPQYSQTIQHVAYQTPNTSMQPQRVKKFNKITHQKKPNSISPVMAIQEQKAAEWSETFKQTVNLLSGCKAGEEVNILMSYLQPPRTTWVKTKDMIHKDLMAVMQPLGIEKLLVFGSTLTGLDFHGSDLDYYVQVKNAPSQEDEIKNVLNRATKLLRMSQRKEFQVMHLIPSARVPIIRILHKATKVTCDVNFTSKFGFYNSYFIGHILGYDKRIKELAVVLKLWSKTQKLAQSMIISNYCLMMLMIFYLQNLEEPMLDTICNNQRGRSPMILDHIFKWNFYFNDSINKSKKNQMSLRELLVEFFEFYDKINYDEYVLSLYTGSLITRKSFDGHADLEDYRNTVKANNLTPLKADCPGNFIVQDGFELNLNIGIKNKKHTGQFFELIKLSHKKCVELKDKPFSELLTKLFTDIELPKNENETRSKNKKQFQMTIHATGGDLKACQDILLKENPSKVYSAEDQQKFFYEHALEYTQIFLKDYYLCRVIPEISDENQPKQMQARLKVILQFDTINGRKKMSFKDDESCTAEKTLSSKMLEKKINLDLDCLMVISSKDKGKTIDIDMFDYNNVTKKSSLLSFGNYFSINIATALKYYLKKRWDIATA